MNTQSGTHTQGLAKTGAESTIGKEVARQALRLVRNSLEEEEHRWIEIGSEAERALEREPLSAKEQEVLRALIAERDVRLEHIAQRRCELRGQ